MHDSAAFSCLKCGNCCRPSGFVRLADTDVDRLATHLDISTDGFTQHHTQLSPDRSFLTINEKPDGSCIFLEPSGECRVYAARPEQCRGFPVRWNYPGYEQFCRSSMEVSACQ